MTINVTVKAGLDGSTWQTPRADITWTDITAYVKHSDGVSISRGRSTSRDEVRAGQCSLTLIDRTRRFDPENAAGPYFGFLNPGVPLWIYCAVGGEDLVWGDDDLVWDGDGIHWGGGTFSRFFGFIEDWPQGSTNPADRVVEIPVEANDAFAMLALGRLQDPYEKLALADSPRGFWPLDEQSGSIMRDLSDNHRDGTYTTGATQLSAEVVTALGARHRGLKVTGEHVGITTTHLPTQEAGFGALIDLSSVIGDLTPGDMLVLAETGAGDGKPSNAPFQWGVEIVSASGQTARLFIRSDTPLAGGFGYSATFDASYPRFVASTAGVLFGDAEHYVDGAFWYGVSSPPDLTSVLSGVRLLGRKSEGDNYSGFVSGLVWSTIADLPQPTVSAYQLAALRPGYDDTTDERIDRILDAAGFPTDDRDLTAGYTTLGTATYGGNYSLDEIRRIEKTEQGRFFIDQDGDATFHARYHGQLVATTSQATFSDAGGSDSPYSQVEVNRPRSFIFNKVTVTTDGQAPAVVEDAASIAAHGERELSIDAPLLRTPNEQRSLAEYVLANSKDPQLRVFGLSVPLHRDFEFYGSTVLGLEQGDRVTFERTPVGTGATISVDQVVEGYTEHFDTRTWTWTPHLSPAEPVTYGMWGTGAWGTTLIWGY